MILIFWAISLTLLLWTYLFYPVVIWLISRSTKSYVKDSDKKYKISLIIAAHNEEDVIKEKIINSLSLNYDKLDWEVIVISDGSSDKTNEILDDISYREKNLNIFKYQPRAGKTNALNFGVSKSMGEILIFSDANVILESDAIINLIRPFNNRLVGVACGKVSLKCHGDEEIAGESYYMKYESWIQNSESSYFSMVGVDGALYAIRRDLFQPLPKNIILDDFTISMLAPMNAKRIVYEPKALASELVVSSVKNEFKRKIRIVAGGFQYLLFKRNEDKSLPLRMWFMFISHKIIRWLSPFILLIFFILNILLYNVSYFDSVLIMQILFYVNALLAYTFKKLRKYRMFYYPYYFVSINLAAFLGFFRFLSGKQQITWEKVRG